MHLPLDEETLRFIRAHREDDVRMLALQARKYPDVNWTTALQQIAGRQAASRKLPAWCACDDLLYPPHLSMEQCSSEATALYKVEVLTGLTESEYRERMARNERIDASFADLTGGFGVDCSYLGRVFARAHYVERQSELCALARHNFPLLGCGHIEVHEAEAETYLERMAPVDRLFLDPARRDGHGGKTVAISDCTPDVGALRPLLLSKAGRILIKLSPMLDISLALKVLPEVNEVHVVSVGNECRELLLAIDRSTPSNRTLHCVNLNIQHRQTFIFTPNEETSAQCRPADRIGRYLYEPNASLLKAGAFCTPAARFDLAKLHPNSHLYTSDTLVSDFPGRIFTIEAVYGFSKQEMKSLAAACPQANLTVRNFPSTVAELRKRLKLREGGAIYLFATTLSDGRKVILQGRKTTNH